MSLTYTEALAALSERGRVGIRLGLGRTKALLGELGDPQLAVRDGQDALDETGEVVGGDRPAVDLDALAVGDEVWLRGRPHAVACGAQGRLRDGEDAALAVRPGDERATDRAFGVVELAQQGPRPPEAQPDTEAAALRQCPECLFVRHSRVSSSS